MLGNFGSLTASQVTATATAAATATSGSTAGSCEKASQHDVAIGVGVGVPLGLIGLALVGLLTREKKRQRKSRTVEGGVGRNSGQGADEVKKIDPAVAPQSQYVPTEAPGYVPNEAHGKAISEAHGDERRAEME